MRTLIFTIAISAISLKLAAQDKDGAKVPKEEKIDSIFVTGHSLSTVNGTFDIDFEQDFFLDFLNNANYDRNYTQGTALSYSKYGLDKSVLFAPLNLFHKLIFGHELPDHMRVQPATISLGVTAFTPRILEDSLNPVLGDRPFANVAFLRTTFRYVNTNTKFLNSTSFSYGIIGSNIGNTFQSFAHKAIVKGRPTDIGWQNQISDGGRPAFLFTHEGSRPILDVNENMFGRANDPYRKSFLQAFLGYKINLGWLNSIALSATIRTGMFSKWSNVFGITNALSGANAAPDNVKLGPDGQPIQKKLMYVYVEPKKKFDWYFFGSLSPRLTPYNSFISGQPFYKSSYTLPHQNYNPFILDAEWGVFLSWFLAARDVELPIWRIDVLASFNSRTSEIISKDPTVPNPFQRTHKWGRVTVRFPLFRDTRRTTVDHYYDLNKKQGLYKFR